jgi:uracil-DNA glycosylase
MHTNIYDLLEPAARTRVVGQPANALLSLKLDEIAAIPKNERDMLRERYRVQTLEDFRRINAADLKAVINPGLWPILLCIFSYPKHDPGPPCAWEELFETAPLSYYQGLSGGTTFHTHFAPVFYRGRLDGTARVLVIGQDPATDETLSGRAFVGQAGQLAQNFLSKIGITRSYVMLNTFLYGVQSANLTPALANDATIQNYRNQLFDKVKATNTISLVLAFGSYANNSATSWPGLGSIPLVHVTHPTAQSGVQANWNNNLATASSHVAADSDGHVDLTLYNTAAAIPPTDIPRRDLPFGTPTWQGTGGNTRSVRGSGSLFETTITWTAP